MNLADICPSAEVVFVSAAPLDPTFAGGFAPRHTSFAEAVAERHPTDLIYVDDGHRAILHHTDPPCGIQNMHVLRESDGHDKSGIRIPRQSVARRLRLESVDNRPLVVTLTSSVAHLALRNRSAVAVLEEGWERLLRPAGRSPTQWALNAAEWLRYRDLYRRIGRSAAHIVAITPREHHHLAQFIPVDRISVVPFGVNTRRFAPGSPTQTDIDVLVVGAMNRAELRAEELILQLQRHPETRSARCTLVGISPRKSILDLASPNVEVTGYVPDVRPYYARAKVVVVLTFTDLGIKTTMLQAWAMERPVVTSPEVVLASEHLGLQSGLVASTIEAMPELVARLLSDSEERERLGRWGRAIILQHHELQRSAEQFANLVDSVLEATAVAR